MRKTMYSFAKNVINTKTISELNKVISKNFIKNVDDRYATGAIKSSQVKFLKLGSIHNFLIPFTDFCNTANNTHFGFDLFQLTGQKIVNYNTYEKNQEYSWHIDASADSTVSDIKLTCLLNLSEENYEGGELIFFQSKEIECKEFNSPGSAVVFPSYMNHKVNNIISGKRNTLSIWMTGSKFR